MPEPGDTPGLREIARTRAAILADTNGVTLPQEQLEALLLDVAREAIARSDLARDGALHRFVALYSAAPIGIALADAEGKIINANPALAALLRTTPADLAGASLVDLGADRRAKDTLTSGVDDLLKTGVQQNLHRVQLSRHHDGPLWMEATLTTLPGDDQDVHYPVLMVQDVQELHELQETLRRQNITDPLTRLPNASSFSARLEEALHEGANRQIALIYLDLDGFKMVNDGHGAEVGDRVLRDVAIKLTTVFQPHNGFVARLSGDGFAVLLEGDLGGAEVTNLVDQALEDLIEPVYVGDEGIGVNASAGIVVRPQAGLAPQELLRAAEIALHRAKEAGKAQWVMFDPELDARDRDRYRLGASIAGALETGQFRLNYVPIVHLSDQRTLSSFNAEPCWEHPEHGPLGAEEFFPLAAVTGMTSAIGRWLFGSALDTTARWRAEYGDQAPVLCVTLPDRLAVDGDLIRMLRTEAEARGLAPDALRLCVECAALLDPRGDVLESINILAGLGVVFVMHANNSADIELIGRFGVPAPAAMLGGAVVDAVLDEQSTEDSAGAGAEEGAAARHLRQLVQRASELNVLLGARGVHTAEQAARLFQLGIVAGRGNFLTSATTVEEAETWIGPAGQ